MEWNEKLQAIIDYVEEHLQRTEEAINPLEIERLAGCSYSFFQKVFSYMNDMSFAEYVRYRKLTLAGYDVMSTQMKIIDISYKYGYDSPTSFTKAFQQFHGVSPSQARKTRQTLKVYPKMQLHMKQSYDWRLEEKSAMRLIGKSIRLSYRDHVHFQSVPEFWSECQRNGDYAKLYALDEGNTLGMFGLFHDYNTLEKECTYSIMVINNHEKSDEYDEILIPDATWAIFDCRGSVPQAIQEGWKFLYQEWLVQYPFLHDACPELEWYSSQNTYAKDYLSQIWIPIIEED